MRLTARLLAMGLALGGAVGVRLSQSFGLIVSRNTLLRVIRRAPCPAIIPPQVLSVDDFALRKGQLEGRVDQGHTPVETVLLPGRVISGPARLSPSSLKYATHP